MYYFRLILLMINLFLMPVVFAQDEAAGGEPAKAEGGARYVDIKPAFVVNYGGAGRLRYLKTSIALRIGGGDGGQINIRRHMPYIRHTLVMMLSRATEEELSSVEGKELLRQNALEAVKNILLEEENEENVFDLLFNSFVVQR